MAELASSRRARESFIDADDDDFTRPPVPELTKQGEWRNGQPTLCMSACEKTGVIAIGNADGSVGVLSADSTSFRENALIKAWVAHEGSTVRAIAYCAGNGIVTGGGDGVIRVWRMMMDDEEQGKNRTSCTNRNNRNNFVYGEVVLEPFYDFLLRSSEAHLPQSSSSRKYYDLGSGTGKSVFIAALTGKFSFAGGCEILECLHGVATTVVEDYREMIEPMTNAMNNSNNKTTELRVDLDDIFSVERVRMWSQCEYVFCNCLTWEDEQMETLARAAEHLKEGAIFVTVLLPLPSEKFEVIAEEECLFSWGGEAPLVIHRKRRQLEGENDLLISLGKLNNERCS